MNPNSRNQLWSRWTWRVYPGRQTDVPFPLIRDVFARYARKRFGSAGQMRVTRYSDYYVIDLRIEGKPAHDPDYARHERMAWEGFFLSLFGNRTHTELRGPKIEAGSRQDGRPPDQLIIIPPIPLFER